MPELIAAWQDLKILITNFEHFRTANASDSSQMRDIMWSPPSPETNREEVEEEPCIAIGRIFDRDLLIALALSEICNLKDATSPYSSEL